ncbi:MAG: DUF721 domain-containing protein [Pirellulales bacterium]
MAQQTWQRDNGEVHERDDVIRPKRPKAIADVLGELMARRGYGRVQAHDALAEAWARAVGSDVAGSTRVGAFRRGTLEVVVAHSTLVQELAFQKVAILKQLGKLLPEHAISDLRFRVGVVES